MTRTYLDRKTDATARILTITCAVAITIALVYSIWRLQLASTSIRLGNETIREIREYAIRRDAEICPLVHEIRDGVKAVNTYAVRIEEHMKRQDRDLAEFSQRINKPK